MALFARVERIARARTSVAGRRKPSRTRSSGSRVILERSPSRPIDRAVAIGSLSSSLTAAGPRWLRTTFPLIPRVDEKSKSSRAVPELVDSIRKRIHVGTHARIVHRDSGHQLLRASGLLARRVPCRPKPSRSASSSDPRSIGDLCEVNGDDLQWRDRAGIRPASLLPSFYGGTLSDGVRITQATALFPATSDRVPS